MHNTLVFWLSSVDPGKADEPTFGFGFTGFTNPWSARVMEAIDLHAYSDLEGLSSFRGFQVADHTVLPGVIPEDNCLVTSTNSTLGSVNPNNTLVFTFRPATTLSRSGQGSLRLRIPKWFELGSLDTMMYNAREIDACTSEQMRITSSEPRPSDNVIEIEYDRMEPEFYSG